MSNIRMNPTRVIALFLVLLPLMSVIPFGYASAESDLVPVITSIGKKNVRVAGVKSTNKLLEYTIPEELLINDPQFLAVMIEAEKYIGYPYVYGASKPSNRKYRLSEPVYPISVMKSVNDPIQMKQQIEELENNAIPEFLRFNIYETAEHIRGKK